VWVHKSDLDRDGRITEADFVLFKLQQMQRVDPLVLDRLIDRFDQLDADKTGAVDIGKEVPSRLQVLMPWSRDPDLRFSRAVFMVGGAGAGANGRAQRINRIGWRAAAQRSAEDPPRRRVRPTRRRVCAHSHGSLGRKAKGPRQA